MANYIVLDANGVAVNCIEWDGVAEWSPPEGCTVKLQKPGDEFDHYTKCKLDLQTGLVLAPVKPVVITADEGMTIV